MSQLLEEALALDKAGRRAWLEQLSPEHQNLVEALRAALLPEAAQIARVDALLTLPKLGAADPAGSASGLQPGARVGPYELIRVLGAGGMAEVWLARRADGAFKREVALKLPTFMQRRGDLEPRFARERDILASLEHPQIARLYDAGVDAQGLPYLSMEYVRGEPLTPWCDTQQLPIVERLALFLQVLGAVQYAHQRQVIHRDLKPSNILVSESGQVRLLDFGVAKLMQADEADQSSLTSVYGRALTPDYASPELLRGDPIDERSDLYSLGVLLYELLTGYRPYRLKGAASIGLIEQAIATLEVRKPSARFDKEPLIAGRTEHWSRQLRGDLDAIVLKALAKDPAQRYPSAAALAADLQRYLDGKPIQAQPARIAYRVQKYIRRHRSFFWICAAALLVMLATVGYSFYRESRMQIVVKADPAAFAPLPHSIAVLPFANMSGDKDQEYFSDGLADELIDLLAQTPDLQVVARTSSFYFKGKQVTIAEIAKTLNVAHVLEGSVRKSGNTVRVRAELIRADTGVSIWSKHYDSSVKDIFEIQDEIAASVTDALKAKLLPGQQHLGTHRTDSSEAYDQYLLGKQASNQRDYPQAVSEYRRAIGLDANFAAAWAGLAEAEAGLANWFTGEKAGLDRALAAAERAVALAPELPDGYAARGWVRFAFFWDWSGGSADIKRAMSYDPGNSTVQLHYSQLLGGRGLLPEAIEAANKAIEADPLSGYAWRQLGLWLMQSRQLPAAEEAFNHARQLHLTADYPVYFLAQVQVLEGHADTALTTMSVLDKDGLYFVKSLAMHSLGRDAESELALQDLITGYASKGATYQIAELYAWRGEADKAFEWLELSCAHHDGGLIRLKTDPFLDGLRSDPRFAAILGNINLPE